ncbi:hypothetical protein TrST_g9951 [Triparma strigata]|uniref:Peptidase M20 dimerisation domain-containing protein n=1 Tax=Triparma strigata TaxID=1606541 RepID=A0A9W7BDZ6_9STRA|nr:hypothetical protein TrST_g9951 [Triparma strigata]
MALSNPALFVTLILCVVVFASIEAAKEKKKSTKIVQTSSASAPSAGWFGGSQASPGDDAIRTSCEEVEDFVVNVRRELHRFPELMYKETKTSAYIQSKLKELDVNFSPGWAVNTKTDRITGPGGTGIVATIGTGTSPVVLLRADIDALPIHEEVESDIKSQTDGQMHACGHDGHTAMLLGAAKVLKVLEASGKIKGTVKLMFQPAEEGGAGGKRMVEEGVLEDEPKVDMAFGIHLWPALPSGTVGGKPGVVLAACDRFEIMISGVGGHAAMPHLVVDPIVAQSALVSSLQTIVSRKLSPLESGVVSVTKIEGGSAFNVIPGAVTLWGTVRSLSTESLQKLIKSVEDISTGIAQTHGCNATVRWSPDYYPPTMNDDDLWFGLGEKVASKVAANGEVTPTNPTMGAEDFGFIAQSVPSNFYLLGQSSEKMKTDWNLHHPKFTMDETVLKRGVELHVRSALEGLAMLAKNKKSEF